MSSVPDNKVGSPAPVWLAQPARQDQSSPPLVSSPISQRSDVSGIELYRNTIKYKRPFYGDAPTAPDRSNTEITGFSSKSQRRLRETAINSGQPLISQFCATYAENWPTDGREIKKHLNSFLQVIRRKYPDIGYLWALEFQTRNAPHYHIFLTIPASDSLRIWLGTAWNRIADPDSEKHRWWHTDRVEKNGQSALIPWNMGSGSYICKYLDKQHQKIIPEEFSNTGRFWGNSRGLVPEPEIINPKDLEDIPYIKVDRETGEILVDTNQFTYITRSLGKYQEKIYRKSWFRNTSRSTSVLTGAPIYRQLINHLQEDQQHEKELQSTRGMRNGLLDKRFQSGTDEKRTGCEQVSTRVSGFATFVWLAGDQNSLCRPNVQPDSDSPSGIPF